MSLEKFKSDLPYPVIDGNLCANDYRCLINDYAGRDSETTAIFAYMYQHYILKIVDPDLADIVENVAIVEMQHHDMLGSAIALGGGDPIIAGTNCFWSGSNIKYYKDICSILRYNYESEKQAIANYRRTIMCLKSPQLIKLIERIILDEQIHMEIFGDLLEKYNCCC